MKKLFFYLTPLLAAGLMLAGVSCTKTDSPDQKCEEMTVSLNLIGEFDAEVDQDPITKAASTNDAYGINVYYDKDGDGYVSDLYAYGLFDNVADMTITLLSNHKYKLKCGLVKDARNVLYFGQAFGNTYSGYAYPFQTNASSSTLINNKFIIGTSTYLTGLTSGNAHLSTTSSPSTSNYSSYPSINRFYGETDKYEPVPNGTIDIYLKRVVFGAKFVISGLTKGEGFLKVTCGNFYSKTFSEDNEGEEKIYTFPSIYNVWANDLPLVATTTISYDSDRGSLWDLSQSQEVQFKRNVMTTVYIQVKPDLSGATLSFTEEAMDEDNVIDMGINTDGLIDIVVNPEN